MAVTDKRTKDHYLSQWDGLSPRWFKSGEIDLTDDDDDAVLFSFPSTPSACKYFMHNMYLNIPTLFLGGTTVLVVGEGTMGDDDDTPGTIENADVDEFFTTAIAIPGTAGFKTPITATNYFTGLAANTAAIMIWNSAATDIPCIFANLTSDGTITAGSGFLYVLLSRIYI